MMRWRQWTKSLYSFLRPGEKRGQSTYTKVRGQITHVIILDGTMSSIKEGCESNAGLTYKLLAEMGVSSLALYYEAGLQLDDWRTAPDVLMGRGINRQIRRAYGYLASRYRSGDRVFLIGYSRGAFAVRSLAGVIDRIGLLKAEHATERNIRTAYRHYQCSPGSEVAGDFSRAFCHEGVEIEMVGVWDTVKALGWRLPLMWRWSERTHAFHNHRLGKSVRRGYHALAMDETRKVFEPVLWQSQQDFDGVVEQVWFRGTHGDIGGQLSGFSRARPLANIPLVWMLERMEDCGLTLPEGWRERFPTDVHADSIGTWKGWGKIFLLRGKRKVCQDRSERLHESIENAETPLQKVETAI